MAQRYEIEAWVNPEAWEDPAAAAAVIDAIEASGSDDEITWAQLADLGVEAELSAASRTYDEAGKSLEGSRETLHALMRRAHAEGVSAYRIAHITGITERHVGRIVRP